MIRPLRQTTLMQSKLHLESPPYRKVRALRLFDTPATPKTLFQKSSLENRTATPANSHCKLIRKSILSNLGGPPQTPNLADRPKPLPVHSKGQRESLTANINPFSPSSKNSKIMNISIQCISFGRPFSKLFDFFVSIRFHSEEKTISNR